MIGLNNSIEIVKALIRKAINPSLSVDTELFLEVDWREVMQIASAHGVLAIAFDGIEALPMDCRPEKKH